MAGQSLHEVRADAFNYVWDNSIEPVLSVGSGEEVMLHVRDASDEQISATPARRGRATRLRPRQPRVRAGGGARCPAGRHAGGRDPRVRPPDWGWTAIIPGFGLLADEFPDPWLRISEVDQDRPVHFADGVTLPYAPFPGTIGVAPPEPGQHSIVPPRWGGNMDIKHLRAGTTLYLPVGVEGALFCVGDTHAAMGDGEVCGTAVETAMDITVRLTVRKDMTIPARSTTSRRASWPSTSRLDTTSAPASTRT